MSLLKSVIAIACMLNAASAFLLPALPSTRLNSIVPFARGVEPRPCYSSSRRSVTALAMAAPVVKRVAIVGAGIGGLTLAKALCEGDMAVQEVNVFEKFESIKPGVGGGVQINSGAVVLARLGLGEAIKVKTCIITCSLQQ